MMEKPFGENPEQSPEESKMNPLENRTFETLCRSVMESTSNSIYMVNREYRYSFINEPHASRLGLPAEQIIGRPYSDFHHPDQTEAFSKMAAEVFSTGKVIQHEYRSLRDNRYFLRTLSPLRTKESDGEILGLVVLSQDITSQKQAEDALRESKEKYKSIIENIEDGYLELTLDWTPLFFNHVWLNMIGYSQDEFTAMNVRHLMNEEAVDQLSQIFQEVYETGQAFRGIELQVKRKDDTEITIEMFVSLILDTKGARAGIRNVIRDVTERRREEEVIRRLAYHDPLTGLPNRLLYRDRLIMAITRAKRHQQHLAIIMMDLDKFKDINDTLGHYMGDRLLQGVGERLTGLLRKVDTVARVGGDEFLLLLPEIKKIEDTARIAQKIIDAFQKPFLIDGHEIHITTSIGISSYPDDANDADTLVMNADTAMYRAKDTGRNKYQRFASSMVVKNTK
jgi:diguanylate cyclase (GGDEF)-like protein/PAS domain S-box-containing protein